MQQLVSDFDTDCFIHSPELFSSLRSSLSLSLSFYLILSPVHSIGFA